MDLTSPRRAALAGSLLALLLAAPASAETYTDPAGDAKSGAPGQDITQVDWAYDPAAGTVAGTITLAGAPPADTAMVVAVATPAKDGTCTSGNATLLLTRPDAPVAVWQRAVGGKIVAQGTATRTGAGPAYSITITDPQLVGLGYTCAEAAVTNAAGTGGAFDRAASPVPVALKTRLKVKPGNTARARVTITNAGTTASAPLTARVTKGKGLIIKPRRVKVRPIAPGASRTVTIRLRARGAASRIRFAVTVRGGGLSSTVSTRLRSR